MKDFLIIGLAVLLLLMCMRNKKEQAAMAAAATGKPTEGVTGTQPVTPGSQVIPVTPNSNGGNIIVMNPQGNMQAVEYDYDAPEAGSFLV